MRKLLLYLSLLSSAALAHETQLGDSVAALMHLEPDDMALVGKPARVWFELNLKGGAALDLKLCKCTALVYTGQPSPRVKPLWMGPLETVGGKPGVTLNLVKAGIYTLILDGKPQNTSTFTSFKFQFDLLAKDR